MMKKHVSTGADSLALAGILGGIGTAAIATLIAACPVAAPLLLPSALVLFYSAKRGLDYDVDSVASEGTDELAEEWERLRCPDETVFEISKTLPSGGAFFDLPMTRKYRYTVEGSDSSDDKYPI